MKGCSRTRHGTSLLVPIILISYQMKSDASQMYVINSLFPFLGQWNFRLSVQKYSLYDSGSFERNHRGLYGVTGDRRWCGIFVFEFCVSSLQSPQEFSEGLRLPSLEVAALACKFDVIAPQDKKSVKYIMCPTRLACNLFYESQDWWGLRACGSLTVGTW